MPELLRNVVGYDYDRDGHRFAHDLVFDLLPGFGFAQAEDPHPWAFDIVERPYSHLIGFTGLSMQARSRAAYRVHPQYEDDPDYMEQPWEAAAIELEGDLWSALHRPDADIVVLQARIAQVRTAYQAARDANPPLPTHVEVGGRVVQNIQSVMEQVYDGHVEGRINPPKLI